MEKLPDTEELIKELNITDEKPEEDEKPEGDEKTDNVEEEIQFRVQKKDILKDEKEWSERLMTEMKVEIPTDGKIGNPEDVWKEQAKYYEMSTKKGNKPTWRTKALLNHYKSQNRTWKTTDIEHSINNREVNTVYKKAYDKLIEEASYK